MADLMKSGTNSFQRPGHCKFDASVYKLSETVFNC